MFGETDGEDMFIEFEGEAVSDWMSANIFGEGELSR
jgi:hypothetical protein